MILHRPIVFFDLETTGVDTVKDKIVQVGMIKIHPNGKREAMDYLINPTIPIPAEASEVHGITDEDVKDAPIFRTVADEIHAFIAGCDVGGFNSNRFDVPFLFNSLYECGITWDMRGIHLIDVYTMYVRNNPRTLEAAYAQYVGGEFDAHDAVADIEATAKVWEALMSSHDEVPLTIEQQALYCNNDKRRADLEGKFYWEGETLMYNFSKHKDEPVKDHPGFLDWMITKDFSPATLMFVRWAKSQLAEGKI